MFDGCETISSKGNTERVAIPDETPSLIALPVERAVPTVTADPIG